MSTSGGEPWKELGIIVGTIGGIIGLCKVVVMPLVKSYQRWRVSHPPFKRTVLSTLKQLKKGQEGFDDFNAALLRERLESAYTIYFLEMGWCPSGEKRLIKELFDIYEKRGWNHIDLKHRESMMSLPESKENRIDFEQ
jgi:hypothetical protein